MPPLMWARESGQHADEPTRDPMDGEQQNHHTAEASTAYSPEGCPAEDKQVH